MALAAFAITAVLAFVGVSLSFYIAHGASFIERSIATVVFWPAFIIMLAFGESGMPDLAFHVLVFAAEYLYIWALAILTIKVARALKGNDKVAL